MVGAIWTGEELVIAQDLEVREPGPNEVLVRVLASGLCHSDIAFMSMSWDNPIVLGHEAAGVVERCGADVQSVTPGVSVAIGCMAPCGVCRDCRQGRYAMCPSVFGPGEQPFSWGGKPVYSMARVSSFASYIVVHETQVLPYAGLQPEAAALIGCAVCTGYGNVRNVARVVAGDVVVVIGVGGIGVNAIQTACLQGARRVIAVDVNDEKGKIAARFGADAFLVAIRGEPADAFAERLKTEAGGSIDAVIECSGASTAIDVAIAAVGKGGRVAVIGFPPEGTRASFDVNEFMAGGKTISGGWNGQCDPYVDLPEIVRLAQNGELEVESQISRVWPLSEIHEAIAALERGEVVRAALDLR